MATDTRPLPVVNVCWLANVSVAEPGTVVLTNTETLLLPAAASVTTMSALPSPFRSLMATDWGSGPV